MSDTNPREEWNFENPDDMPEDDLEMEGIRDLGVRIGLFNDGAWNIRVDSKEYRLFMEGFEQGRNIATGEGINFGVIPTL
ncbi:MAG TPA: hypothetical protein VMW29_01210 [Candidatus Bathyarchaeia archaeon]|nr:hypothetical protein [Candidatus Bathyarchaeia archaeon]